MSDPVENIEIEDVLSSIRRLVSTDDREERATRPTIRRAEESREAGADARARDEHVDTRLVLTPALRVDEADAPEEAAASEPEPSAAPADHAEQGHDAPESAVLEEDDAQAAAYGGEEDMDDEWDGVEDAEFVDVTEPDAAQAQVAELDAPSDQRNEHDTAHDKAKLPEFLRHADAHKHHQADHESAQEDANDHAEADAGEDAYDAADADADADADAELLSRVENFSAAMDDAEEGYDPEPGSDDENAPEDVAIPLPWADMEAANADSDAQEATAQDADTEHPDTEGADTEGADAEDDLEDDWTDRDAAPKSAVAGARGSEDWLDEDAVIDEDMLRDMVAEIVRQELQGALGERITRNVRKLVRREINRALMSQGID